MHGVRVGEERLVRCGFHLRAMLQKLHCRICFVHGFGCPGWSLRREQECTSTTPPCMQATVSILPVSLQKKCRSCHAVYLQSTSCTYVVSLAHGASWDSCA